MRCYNAPMPAIVSKLLRLTLCTLLALEVVAVRAEIVSDVYRARVPVDDRRASTLDRARSDGLVQVVVKASGDTQAAENEAILAAAKKASRFLRSYGFEESESGLVALLDYDEAALRELLVQAGLPLWTANRPRVLAWVVIHDGDGRHFASASETPLIHAALQQSFQLRGLPLQLPLLDLEDAARISPGEAWRQSSGALLRASERYGEVELLAGRVATLSDGRWVGEWRLLDNGRWVVSSVDAASLDAFAEQGAALAADLYAGRYAVAPRDQGDERLRITLRGIHSFAHYRSACEAIRGLESVQRVVPEHVLGDEVSLRVHADADQVQLAKILELDHRFVATDDDSVQAGLRYEYIP